MPGISGVDLFGYGVGFLMSIFPLLAVGIVVLLIVRSRRSGAQLPPVPTTGDLVLQGHLWRPGDAVTTVWNEASYGTVTVSATELFWWSPASAWRTPLTTITVIGADGFLGITGPAVDLDIAGSGRWRLRVSRARPSPWWVPRPETTYSGVAARAVTVGTPPP